MKINLFQYADQSRVVMQPCADFSMSQDMSGGLLSLRLLISERTGTGGLIRRGQTLVVHPLSSVR